MSVAPINNVSQHPSFVDRLLHREHALAPTGATPPAKAATDFSLRTALRNVAIGGAAGGALGGISMLGKLSLPFIGKVASLGGIARLAGVGGAIGLGLAALPVITPLVQRSPAAKAALLGAGIGGAAGAVLPILPMPLGAIAGAAIGLTVHAVRKHRGEAPTYPTYPGYVASPGWVAVGVVPGYAAGSGSGSGSGVGLGSPPPVIDLEDEFADFPPLAGAAQIARPAAPPVAPPVAPPIAPSVSGSAVTSAIF